MERQHKFSWIDVIIIFAISLPSWPPPWISLLFHNGLAHFFTGVNNIHWFMNLHIPHHKVMVPRASIISESEYPLRFFVCYVHLVTQQYESGIIQKYVCNQFLVTMKNTMVPRTPVFIWNWSIHCLLYQLCSNHYTVVQIKNCLKSTSVVKVVMKNTDFRYTKEAIMCNHPINTFHCQQRWMKHKRRHW